MRPATWSLLLIATLIVLVLGVVPSALQGQSLPTLDEALAAKQDVWGLAAIKQPNGSSYEFFANLLPPLRYVNAAFRYYPIVLSAPGSVVKARIVSNGSAINARANLKTWKDAGTPVTFRVRENHELFGEDFRRLRGPKYEQGYLPVVKWSYEEGGSIFEQECFAAVESPFSDQAVVFTKFHVSGGSPGTISAHLGTNGNFEVSKGAVRDTNGHVLIWFSDAWKWDANKQTLVARLTGKQTAVLATPVLPASTPAQIDRLASVYGHQRARCVARWQKLLDQGSQLSVPEPLVNDAWRALVVGSFMLLKSNSINYSAGNQYERLYQAECGDSARALALFGYTSEAGKMIPPLLHYTREGLRFHNAGFKLQTLSHYYWLTRDTAYINSVRDLWEPEVRRILDGREKDTGLFPRERYCGDIGTMVYSLHSNGACWRGLRDFAAVLADIQAASSSPSPPTCRAEAQREGGAEERAGLRSEVLLTKEGERRQVASLGQTFDLDELRKTAADFRQAVLSAADKSVRTDIQPHFIPVALSGEEKPYDTLTASMMGSYWDLIAPYMLGSGMFGPGSARERAIVDYLQERGGICMGMIRFHQHSGLFANEDAVDDLYSLRYTIKLLQLDEVDRALVSFYGKLAQGLTRDTFIGAEGTGLRPLDEFGRPMYLPPNSTSDAFFLWTLRYLLIQDWDMDDDGKPETLRLGFATPQRWLEDGKMIKFENAPTAFGPISMRIESRLSKGAVLVHVRLPTRNPARQTLLRVRVPDGWSVQSAKAGSRSFKVDEHGTADISGLSGETTIHFAVIASTKAKTN